MSSILDRLVRSVTSRSTSDMANSKIKEAEDTAGNEPSVDFAPPRNFVFIVTYGRSGSTLLQAILNSIDGYKIVGENYNALVHLLRSCRSVRQSREDWGRTSPAERGWTGADQYQFEEYEAEVVAAFIKHVLRPGRETRVSGFKEIRWDDCSEKEFFANLRLIESRFAGTRILLNKRIGDEVINSSWWRKQDPAKVRALVKRMDNWFDQACAENAATRYIVNYNDYTTDPENLRGMFGFLGEPFFLERVKKILAVRV